MAGRRAYLQSPQKNKQKIILLDGSDKIIFVKKKKHNCMERHFELELEKLNNRLKKMAGIVANQVNSSIKALLLEDVELAKQIIEQDRKVDKLDNKIDKLCQRIFALTQPVATDLRFIMSSLKINNDLERMGDHAVGIAYKIETLTESREVISSLNLDEVAADFNKLMELLVAIIEHRNVNLVKEIFDLSTEIHNKLQTLSAVIIEEMAKKSEIIVVATNLMLILTQLERIEAYTTNIAESIVFIVEGKLVKHPKLVKANPEFLDFTENMDSEHDSHTNHKEEQ
jgi:phosphate transport system protein